MQKTMLVTRKGEIFHKWSRVSVLFNQDCIEGVVTHSFPISSHESYRNSKEKPNERT